MLIVHRDNAGCIPALGRSRCASNAPRGRSLWPAAWKRSLPTEPGLPNGPWSQSPPTWRFFRSNPSFPKRLIGACVLTVHDVQHLLLPRNISWAERVFRRAIYPWSLCTGRWFDRCLRVHKTDALQPLRRGQGSGGGSPSRLRAGRFQFADRPGHRFAWPVRVLPGGDLAAREP